LAKVGEESPEFLAELDARIRALDHSGRTYSLDEAHQMVRDTAKRARRPD
jgi:triosephosphate isomerase